MSKKKAAPQRSEEVSERPGHWQKKAIDAITELEGARIELNAWKRRARALERALKEEDPCPSCVYHMVSMDLPPCRDCAAEDMETMYEFDEARFRAPEDWRAELEGGVA